MPLPRAAAEGSQPCLQPQRCTNDPATPDPAAVAALLLRSCPQPQGWNTPDPPAFFTTAVAVEVAHSHPKPWGQRTPKPVAQQQHILPQQKRLSAHTHSPREGARPNPLPWTQQQRGHAPASPTTATAAPPPCRTNCSLRGRWRCPHRGELQGSGSQQFQERLNSVRVLKHPEETLRVPSI